MARSSAQTGARTRFVLGAAVLSATLVAAAVLASRELRVVVPASDGVVPAVQYVGITYIPLSHEVAARCSLEAESGLLVTEVASDGPAARAGLRRGDRPAFRRLCAAFGQRWAGRAAGGETPRRPDFAACAARRQPVQRRANSGGAPLAPRSDLMTHPELRAGPSMIRGVFVPQVGEGRAQSNDGIKTLIESLGKPP